MATRILNYKNFMELVYIFSNNIYITKDKIKNYTQEDLNEALKYFCSDGKFEVVRNLVDLGANVSVDDNIPIQCAAEKKYYDIILYLANKGANIRACKNLDIKDVFSNRNYSLAKCMVENNIKIEKTIDLLILCRFYGLSTRYLE